MSTVEERMKKGEATMIKLGGPKGADKRGLLYEMNPKFADLMREVLFGEVWGDQTLDIKYRSIATTALLIALDRQPEVRMHLRNALNLGFTKEQLLALITHVAFYAGVPTAVNALSTAKEVFARWDERQAQAKQG